MRLDKYEVVSFDVFDTLVKRCVAKPSDVFRLVELRAKTEGLLIEGFTEARVLAEKKARAKYGREVTLDEIYAELASSGYPASGITAAKELELKVEFDVCVPHPEGRELFESAQKASCRLVIASDMYLPMSEVVAILTSCGYSGWDRIFLSCECGVRKADGSMFAFMSKELGVQASHILHIGDNLKSDILRARSKGLHAWHMSRKKLESDDLAGGMVSALRDARVATKDPLVEFGYRAFGPLLAGLASWLAVRCEERRIEKVFFLARDGLIIKKAVELLGCAFPSSTYFYASRRALLVPTLTFKDTFHEAISSMFLGRTTSLRSLFDKMGLESDSVYEVLVDLQVDPDKQRQSSHLEEDADALKAYKALRESINGAATDQLDLLTDYLRQESFQGKVAIVDIGWFGNMQVALESVCEHSKIDADIIGYYVGLCPDGQNQKVHKMEGYLYSAGTNEDLYLSERNFNSIFEIMFSACHGTTRGYEKNGNSIEPMLAPYFGAEAKAGDAAERIRSGALEFVLDWARVCGLALVEIEPEVAFAELIRMGNQPTLSEAETFGSWAIEDGGAERAIAESAGLAHYIGHPKDFLRDFDHARWKIGFLRRVFKVPAPYGRAWDAVHAMYKKRHT